MFNRNTGTYMLNKVQPNFTCILVILFTAVQIPISFDTIILHTYYINVNILMIKVVSFSQVEFSTVPI